MGKFMDSAVLLASSMAPCRTILASQLIEKISLECNNHSIIHHEETCTIEQILLIVMNIVG